MTVKRIAIGPCPERGCSGSLRSPVHALTMRCACDACAKEYLVAYVGITVPWDEASPALRHIALDAIVQIAYWNERFAELKKSQKIDDIVSVDSRQKRADALTRADATHKRLLKSPWDHSTKKSAATDGAGEKAQIIPRSRLEEARERHEPKSIDDLLDNVGKKAKKGH